MIKEVAEFTEQCQIDEDRGLLPKGWTQRMKNKAEGRE